MAGLSRITLDGTTYNINGCYYDAEYGETSYETIMEKVMAGNIIRIIHNGIYIFTTLNADDESLIF